MAEEPALTPAMEFISALLDSPPPSLALTEVGTVSEVGDGIAVVSGLARALADELLVFASGVRGVVLDLEPGRLGVILLGASERVRYGEAVWRTHKVFSVPVGPGLIGRIVDATGEPRDGKGWVESTAERPVEANAPGILRRAPVTRPLATGIKAIDGAVPVGLGQRELIIGDRQTGKTSLVVDTILNQARSDVLSIYCAIGQRGDAVAQVIETLRQSGQIANTLVVAAGDEDAPGLAYIAPYAAMTMAEFFSNQGRDVLVVLDDLTHHARSLPRAFPATAPSAGAGSISGDIFYVHARLLERAGQFTPEAGEAP